jgi:ornithine carbamoyltransferase
MTGVEGSLVKELDLDVKQLLSLVEFAEHLKRDRMLGRERGALRGRHIALLFERSSTRTRCAFESALAAQGGHVTFIGAGDSPFERQEAVADTARVLGRMYDGIAYSGADQETVEELAAHAGVPVWNALTDSWHPTQVLADVMTMFEYADAPAEKITYCYTGDGRNSVARSLLITGALLGSDVRIAAPRELQPPADVVAAARELAATSGARISVTDDPSAAVAGAQFVYTDVWLNTGDDPASWDERVELLTPFRVDAGLMRRSGRADTRFLHCLPALHSRRTLPGEKLFERYGLDGIEVSDEVFESAASVVFDQAENRMHTIKAVLVAALSG